MAGGGAAIANAASSNGINDTVARQREPELPGHVARQMRAAPALLQRRTRRRD